MTSWTGAAKVMEPTPEQTEVQPAQVAEQTISATKVVVEKSGPREMKFVLGNLPKFMAANLLRKLVAEGLKIPAAQVNCKKAPKWQHALLSLKSEGLQEDVLARLKEIKLKSGPLDASIDDGTVRSLAKSGKFLKREVTAGERCLNDQVTPLWKVPYEEQLVMKQAAMQEVIEQVELKKEGFVLEPIKPSPQTHNYRNKCEFSFGFDKEGKATLGFSLGGFREGVTVANASDCLHVPESMKALANAVQEHIRGRTAEAPVFDRESKTGFWRILMVRSHGEKMMVVLQAQEGTLSPEALEQELALFTKVVKSFKSEDGMTVGSLYVQMTSAVHHGMDPKATNRLVHGSEKLVEELDGLKYEISLSSFFQVNKPATLVLYSTIKEYVSAAGLAQDMVLLDLCCGTGTIGMMMAPHVGRVIGVELVPEAIEDARRNAELNGITNIEFKCAKVEDAITELIASLPPSVPIAVILDPPRSGIHKSVIKSIRNCPRISSLVFVSCNPKACMQNYADLGKEASRATSGNPFALARAVPVDMFPMTEHCELVLKFDRL